MKIKTPFLASIALVAVFTLFSCKKDAQIPPNPYLTITAPTGWQTVTGGSSVRITGTATASGSDDIHLLHELSLSVRKKSSNAEIWRADFNVHDLASYVIDTTFTAPAATTDSLILTAALANHVPNTTTQTVTFAVRP
jgi:hypothetical protein